MRLLASLFFLLCTVMIAYTQSSKIDSLRLLSESLKGTKRVDVLNKLAWELVSFDLNKSKELTRKAIELSEQIHYERGKAEALIYQGYCEFSVGNDELSKQRLKESIVISKRVKQDTLQGFALAFLGRNYQNLAELDSSFYFLNQSYEILKDSIHPYYLSLLYVILADHYGLKNQSSMQLQYLTRSWAIRDKLKDKRYLVYSGERLASYFTSQGNYPEALSYLRKAQQAMGNDTINNEEISVIYKERAIIYVKQGYYTQALKLLSPVIEFFERNGLTKELANLYSQVGYVFVELDNYETGLKNYFKALAIAEENHYEFEYSKLLTQIGRVYFFLDQLGLAKQFTQKGLTSAQRLKHRYEESTALNLLGMIADKENRREEALQYLAHALVIRKAINDKVGIAGTAYNLGVVYEKQKDFKKALDYQLMSLSIEESLNHQIGMAYSYQSLGELYSKMDKFKESQVYLKKAEGIAKSIGSGNVMVDIYRSQRDILLSLGKFKEAAEYTNRYETLKDSIFNRNMSNRIAALQTIFELDQKDNAIENLNQQKLLQNKQLELQQAQIRQQWAIILVGTLGFLGLIIVVYVIYKYYTRIKLLNEDISERNEKIQMQSEKLTEANEVLLKLNRKNYEQKEEILAQAEELMKSNQIILGINDNLEERIEARTSELKQAYKELDTFFYRSSHDFRRPLTTFMGLAEVAKITVKDKMALELFDKVNLTAKNLDKMLMKLQSISDVGVPELIYKEVLIEEIFNREASLINHDLLQNNIRLEMEVDKDLSFYSYPALIKIMVENLIENAIVFCSVNDPYIRLKAYSKNDELVVEVEDNGQGIQEEFKERVFDMYFRGNESSKGNGLGLYIVKKTADKLKARIVLNSVAGSGTKISIFFPQNLEATL